MFKISEHTGEADMPLDHLRGRWRFWTAAYALLVLLTGTNLATPLYRGYEARFGFSALTVTLIFATYMAVLIPSLLVAGPLADAVDRRVVLLAAVGLAALGCLAFALATGTGWLFAARVAQGLAIGAASGAMTAALTGLEPAGDPRRAALVSTTASMAALGLGPLLGGALAQYAPAPRVLPFVVEITMLVPAAITVAALPPTRPSTRPRSWRPEIPATARSVFVTSGAASFIAFTVVGLFLSLVPTYIVTLSGDTNLFVGGAAVALLPICASLAQLVGYGRRARALETTGLPLLATGLALLALAGAVSSLALLLAAAMIAGVGQGLVFLGGLTAVNQAAPEASRSAVLSSFYVVVYLGAGLPVIGVVLLAAVTGLSAAVRDFAAVVAVLCLALLTARVRGARRTPAIAPPADRPADPPPEASTPPDEPASRLGRRLSQRPMR